MATISADNLQTALITLIKNIVPSSHPTKRFVNIDLGRDSRPQRHEDRMFALIYQGEVESTLCFGARQLQLQMEINYTGQVHAGDVNKIKQTLLTWSYGGLVLADSGPPYELYGVDGETSLQLNIPITLDYKPLEIME